MLSKTLWVLDLVEPITDTHYHSSDSIDSVKRPVVLLLESPITPGQFQLGENEEAFLSRHDMVVKVLQLEETTWSKEILEAGLLDQHWFGIRNALKTGQYCPSLQQYGTEDEMVTYQRRIYIPDSNALKLKVAHQYYDRKVAGHFGRDKTLDLMKRNYYWPNM